MTYHLQKTHLENAVFTINEKILLRKEGLDMYKVNKMDKKKQQHSITISFLLITFGKEVSIFLRARSGLL